MLEPMDAFFTARLDGYDEHMLTDIEGAEEFYPFTASLLPQTAGAKVLDLGCGTGIELEAYISFESACTDYRDRFVCRYAAGSAGKIPQPNGAADP